MTTAKKVRYHYYRTNPRRLHGYGTCIAVEAELSRIPDGWEKTTLKWSSQNDDTLFRAKTLGEILDLLCEPMFSDGITACSPGFIGESLASLYTEQRQ